MSHRIIARLREAPFVPMPTASTLTVLACVRAILDLPDAWARGRTALDAAGRPVSPRSPLAVRFGLHGAVERAAFILGTSPTYAIGALSRAAPRVDCDAFVTYTDRRTTTHADLLALVDRAIDSERLRSRAA